MRLLIVEDEPALTQTMIAYLKTENYNCETAPDIKTAQQRIDTYDYDCILLDISLPDGNGLSILKQLKAEKRADGVIIISAKNSVDDRLVGLHLGADDFLVKPFYLSELSARIAAVIRRRRFDGNKMLLLNEINIDTFGKTVYINEQALELTKSEYDLLLYLFTNKNRVISKNAIAEYLLGDNANAYPSFDFIYAHIKNLKKKLSNAGCQEYIKSIYGMGYKFDTAP